MAPVLEKSMTFWNILYDIKKSNTYGYNIEILYLMRNSTRRRTEWRTCSYLQ